MPATPARISASERKAFSVVSASCGTSVSFVQLPPMTKRIGAISTLPTRRTDFVEIVIIRFGSLENGTPLELRASAKREPSCRRIREIINAAGRETQRDEHFRVVARVLG